MLKTPAPGKMENVRRRWWASCEDLADISELIALIEAAADREPAAAQGAACATTTIGGNTSA